MQSEMQTQSRPTALLDCPRCNAQGTEDARANSGSCWLCAGTGRTSAHHAKAHWIDAACVGPSGEVVDLRNIRHVVEHTARGRGHRQATCVDKHGFPRTRGKAVKRLHGYQSGDRVRLVQPHGKHAGTHEGTVSIRATGQFDLKRPGHPPITAPHQRFRRLERFHGYITTRRAA